MTRAYPLLGRSVPEFLACRWGFWTGGPLIGSPGHNIAIISRGWRIQAKPQNRESGLQNSFPTRNVELRAGRGHRLYFMGIHLNSSRTNPSSSEAGMRGLPSGGAMDENSPAVVHLVAVRNFNNHRV